MLQLICHLIGDYLLQSDWMANNKTSKSLACLCHVVAYTLPFLMITQKPLVLFVIASSHFVIDRWRLAKYVVYAKNFLAPSSVWSVDWTTFDCSCGICNFCNGQNESVIDPKFRWANCQATGYIFLLTI